VRAVAASKQHPTSSATLDLCGGCTSPLVYRADKSHFGGTAGDGPPSHLAAHTGTVPSEQYWSATPLSLCGCFTPVSHELIVDDGRVKVPAEAKQSPKRAQLRTICLAVLPTANGHILSIQDRPAVAAVCVTHRVAIMRGIAYAVLIKNFPLGCSGMVPGYGAGCDRVPVVYIV
jgi:hypothetical protein